MDAATSNNEFRPFPSPHSLGRFRVTIVFLMVSIGALLLASIAVDRVAKNIGEDATVRAGTQIAALLARGGGTQRINRPGGVFFGSAF